MKSISKIKVLAAVAAVVSTVAFGGVFDDAIWYMQPADLNANGIIDSGETVNWLRGGNLDDNTHKATVYGYDENRMMEPVTINSRYLSGYNTTAMLITDANFKTTETSTSYFPGAIVLHSAVANLHDASSPCFSAIVRCCPQDVNSNTRWAIKCGDNGSRGGFEVGFTAGGVRVYSNGDQGKLASGKSCIAALPVTANTWIDLGITVSWKPEQVGDTLVTTGRMHVVMAKVGSDQLLVEDCYVNHSMIPNVADGMKIGVETEVKSATSTQPNTKRFKGHIQQVAYWDRALTDDEFIEAFKYSGRDKSVVGVANASGDEFGGTGTDIVMDGDWRDVPKTLAAGGTYLVQFAGAVDSARSLKVKGTSGATTLQVGGESALIADGGEASFFVPRSAMAEEGGVVSFALKNAGAADLTLDCLSLTDNALVTNSVTYTTSNVDTNLVVAQDHVLVISIPQGYFINMNGVISGEGQVVKAGLGTLKLIAAPTIAGGIAVREGVLRAAGDNLLGTAPVTVIANGATPSQLSLNGTFANNIYVEGESSDECPAIHFAAKTTLNGDLIGSNAVVYLSTAWEDTAAQANTENVTIAGRADATGGTIALAPHCKVNFKKTIYCELLKLYWRPNSATEDGGNPGIVVLATHGDRKNGPTTAIQCYMKNVEIDQTRIIQGGQNIFGSSDGLQADWPCATVRWTGEHRTGGSIDMNGGKMNMGKVYTFETTPDDETSQRIINSGGNKPYCNLLDVEANSRFYAQFEGAMVVSPSRKLFFMNRRHKTTYSFNLGSGSVITGGTRFDKDCLVQFSNGSAATNLSDAAALKHVNFQFTSSGVVNFDQSAVDSLPDDYDHTIVVSKGFVANFTMPAGTVWKVKSISRDEIYVPAGEYTSANQPEWFNIPGGVTMRVATSDGNAVDLGTIHWDGAKWVDAGGDEVTPDHKAGYMVTNTDGADDALLGNDVNLYGINLACAAGGSFTLGSADNAPVRVWGSGFNVGSTDVNAGTEITINSPIEFTDTSKNVITIPSNGTFTVNGGFSGPASFTLCGNAGPNCVWNGTYKYNNGTSDRETIGGVFKLYGDNTFTGGLIASNALVRMKGKIGDEGDTSTFNAYARRGDTYANFWFEGVEVYKNLTVSASSTSDYNSQSALVMTPNSTNVFHGVFSYNGSHTTQYREGSVTWFTGGTINSGNQVTSRLYADAELHFAATLNISTETLYDRTWYLGADGGNSVLVAFEPGVSGHVGILNISGKNAVFEINTDYPFTVNRWVAGFGGTIRLNGTKFAVPCIHAPAAEAVIEGVGEGAAFIVTNATEKISTENRRDTTLYAKVTGTADLVMCGTNTLSLVSSQSTSTGELVAKSGVIKMDAASTWAGAVRVYTGAALQAGLLGAGETTGGTLNLTGVKKVAAIYVNDSTESLPEGLYGAVGSGAPHKVAWITGTGKLRIGNAGMLFIVK